MRDPRTEKKDLSLLYVYCDLCLAFDSQKDCCRLLVFKDKISRFYSASTLLCTVLPVV